MSGLRFDTGGDAVAVVVARDGRLPTGADETVAGAGGNALVIGSGAEVGAGDLGEARQVWWSETGPGFRPGALAAWLAPVVEAVPLLVMPASADGRDLAPRLAARLGRPLVARAVCAEYRPDPGPGQQGTVRALVARLDDRVVVPVTVGGPAVVTVAAGGRHAHPSPTAATVAPLPDPAPSNRPGGGGDHLDPDLLALLEPDLHTMDLSDATRVVAGGAGLVAGLDDHHAALVFDLLIQVAAALGGSAGATRVATDAGWTGYERQVGTTGVAIDPDLYVALGVSGASQHVGGLGTPRHVISVNTDASSPMTAMADLGVVTDARGLLVELAHRLGVAVPAGVESPGGPGADHA